MPPRRMHPLTRACRHFFFGQQDICSAAEVVLPRRVRVAAVLRSSVHSPVEASRMTEPSFYWLAGLAKNSVSGVYSFHEPT